MLNPFSSCIRRYSATEKKKKQDEEELLSSSLSTSSSTSPLSSLPVGISSLGLHMEADIEAATDIGPKNTILLCGSYFRKVRILHRLCAVCHCAQLGAASWGALSASKACPGEAVVGCSVAAAASAIRVLWMIGSAVAQAAVAATMMGQVVNSTPSSASSAKPNLFLRKERRMRYVRWIWWGRCGGAITLLQLAAAVQLTILVVKNASTLQNRCYTADSTSGLLRTMFILLALLAWVLLVAQCCIGSDILQWRSLYLRHSGAWQAYYHEMFDYGIREALCCLGRAHYIASDEDEVDSVAAVLGDLVSYRASGASHLEFLAGLALLQLQKPQDTFSDDFSFAPSCLIREATALHPFAVAAYTGPLLDVGRNPLLFLCAWVHRQGVFAPWRRSRRPHLEGDNWWRGHAAAFLAHLKLPPEALYAGRVYQAKREAAYFVTIVHEIHCVVVAVRGTETPEDLLTDGLGRECLLTELDMHGILQSERISESLKQHLFSTGPHFGHEGIVEAARELTSQLDDPSDGISKKKGGLLSSLLGPGGMCEGYGLRIVGHSLGGSIAAVAAMRLYGRYPQIHVYGYGVLPCLDFATADACANFVTSIVYNDEFSSRLSVSSVRRLRLAAVEALTAKTTSGTNPVAQLARQLIRSEITCPASNAPAFKKEVTVSIKNNKRHKYKRLKFQFKGGIYLCSHACHCMMHMSNYSSSSPLASQITSPIQLNSCGQFMLEETHEEDSHATMCAEGVPLSGDIDQGDLSLNAGKDSAMNGVCDESEVLLVNDSTAHQNSLGHENPEEADVAQSGLRRKVCEVQENEHEDRVDGVGTCAIPMEASSSLQEENYRELFVPGLIIHLVPCGKEDSWQFWQGWRKKNQHCKHMAFIKDRRCFQDIVVSLSMFLDHMPWRCQYALNNILEHAADAKHVSENGILA